MPIETTKDQWQVIRLPFKEFLFVSGGQLSTLEPEVGEHDIGKMGFVLSQRYQGPFELEVDYVDLIKEAVIRNQEKTRRFNLLPD